MGDLKQYWFVIRELTGREIKRKYARSYLGILWSVLSPLLYMLVMTLVFSTMFKRSIQNFPLYYLAGYLFWNLYGQISNSVMTVLVDNRNLLLRVKVPKNVFVLSRCYTALVNFLYTLLAFFPLVFLSGVKPSITMLLFPIDIVLCVMFGLGVGYILSILYVFFADIKYLYTVFLTMLMYMSALFYPVEQVPAAMQMVINNNPVYCYMLFARDTMIYSTFPTKDLWIKAIFWAVAAYLLGYLVFRRRENEVMQNI
ncbi:ABC transporter permease [Butyrivibrio sp. INlla16]|uniref:ABC transporter permease n=1 Tax=Butyrivibrio sp. INlla16 TaxID=1520807 RepID=UPI000885340B|nr:ABC transporter permease [Butyrivibrio sp. INlla16]SDB32248.1 ABC-2 type transport system permease protein [Butyrivibrio sp. INlla16]